MGAATGRIANMSQDQRAQGRDIQGARGGWTEAIAPAKVNLTLHITGQRDDGYHMLDSLVAFTSGGDRLRLRPAGEFSLRVSGPFASGVPTDARNLVWKAAELAGWVGEIELVKNLPNGAGIGGGSSDAAALLRAVGFAGDAASLGADLPVCQLGRYARMSGIGEIVEALPGFPVAALFVVLVNPGVHVPTPAVFKALTRKQNAPMGAFPSFEAGASPWLDWLRAQRNDLEAPAIQCAPVIAEVLAALCADQDCLLARMSGSGATCFGIYPNRAAQAGAVQRIQAAHPDWWCLGTSLN